LPPPKTKKGLQAYHPCRPFISFSIIYDLFCNSQILGQYFLQFDTRVGLGQRGMETVRLWIGHDRIIGISPGDNHNEEIGGIDDTI